MTNHLIHLCWCALVPPLMKVPRSRVANAAVFIVDNAAAHRPAVNVQLPNDYGLCFLPPYSPFLNICENAFAIWKAEIETTLAEVRHELLTQPHQQRMATLAQLAEQGINVVTAQKLQAAFRGMQRYLPACFGREDIFM